MSTVLKLRFICNYSTKILNCPSCHSPDYMPAYVKAALICPFQKERQRDPQHFRDLRWIGVHLCHPLRRDHTDKNICFSAQHGVNCWKLSQHLIRTNRDPQFLCCLSDSGLNWGFSSFDPSARKTWVPRLGNPRGTHLDQKFRACLAIDQRDQNCAGRMLQPIKP